MGPIAIRALVVRLARRGPLRALALVLALGTAVAVHHGSMAMPDGALPAPSAPMLAPAGAGAGDAVGSTGTPHVAPAGDAVDDGAAPGSAPDGDMADGPTAMGMSMPACLGVLGAAGIAVIAVLVGVVPLGRWPTPRLPPPGRRAGPVPAARPRAGPVFLVLAVDRR